MHNKILLSMFFVISLALSIAPIVKADDSSPIPTGGDNTLGPYKPTKEELVKKKQLCWLLIRPNKTGYHVARASLLSALYCLLTSSPPSAKALSIREFHITSTLSSVAGRMRELLTSKSFAWHFDNFC